MNENDDDDNNDEKRTKNVIKIVITNGRENKKYDG